MTVLFVYGVALKGIKRCPRGFLKEVDTLTLTGCDRAIPHDVLRSAVGIDVAQCEPGVWSA